MNQTRSRLGKICHSFQRFVEGAYLLFAVADVVVAAHFTPRTLREPFGPRSFDAAVLVNAGLEPRFDVPLWLRQHGPPQLGDSE